MTDLISLLAVFLFICTSTHGKALNTTHEVNNKARAPNTCADPTLASVWVEAYSPSARAHTIQPRWIYANLDTTAGNDWTIQGAVFLAWEDAQPFTFPLYLVFNPALNDYIYIPSTTGSPPVLPSGYGFGGIVGYVYATQVCGSVPLLSAFQASFGDHWYTTDASEHSRIIASGWAEAGIVAYVLPLSKCIIRLPKLEGDFKAYPLRLWLPSLIACREQLHFSDRVQD
ncbi:hypothetical protein GALMADRAFT_147156 [Galerina marginata CBS 339.88]|uniref:DUF5648 domain-containing protein n=1 Tax=Galerina marginata (strain CBS 339.88) TaxID=685588 RepID=A0A067SBP0_GALM3|nr:hypothetical protein GALMADRAFT_147156 [Galerina marginata CBS 339.88]